MSTNIFHIYVDVCLYANMCIHPRTYVQKYVCICLIVYLKFAISLLLSFDGIV